MNRIQKKEFSAVVPVFTLLTNYCEYCQSPLYIDQHDTRFCLCCDWSEKVKPGAA